MATELPKNYDAVKNATLKEVRKNKYGSYDMIVEIKSGLTGTVVEQPVPLYIHEFNTDVVSEDVINRTQSRVREILGDDTITIHAEPDASDQTDIVTWAQNHQHAPISELYTHNGKLRISAPSASNGQMTSMYRKKFNGEGTYDPNTQLLSFFDAQTDENQTQINNLKGSNIKESSYKGRQRVNFFGTARVEDVISVSGVPYQTTPKDYSRDELINVISAILSQDAPEILVPKDHLESDKATAANLQDLKSNENAGLYQILSVLGGFTYVNNVSEERRDAVKATLSTTAISVVTMYLRTPADRVFQLSVGPMRKLDLSRTDIRGFHIEFLKNDFKSTDVLLPLVDGGFIDENEAIAVAKKQNVYDEAKGMIEFKDSYQALDYLRALFKNKEVSYRSEIKNDRAVTEKRLLGSTFVSIQEPSDANVVVETPTETNVAESVSEEIDTNFDPFATDDDSTEDTAPTNDDTPSNPFGV